MLKKILQLILKVLPTLFGISVFSFILIRLIPGDPVLLLLGERGADPETYLALKKSLGLDLPIWQQYFIYLKNVFQFDLGHSVVSKQAVVQEFFARFPATVELGFSALFFAILLGIPLGVLAAVRRNQFIDYFLMTFSLIGYSMPIFWWGPMLIIFFSVGLDILPVSGRLNYLYEVNSLTGMMLLDTLFDRELVQEYGYQPFFDAIKHLILPTVAMGTIPLAVIARMTRSSMLEVLSEDYIRTAKAKGLAPFQLVFKHALRNALVPIITTIGLLLGSIITGAILTETIFSWPGIGKWLVASINARDYPVIQGGILFIATIIIFLNVFVDFLNTIVNPKLRRR